jgi:hypothetical protein
MTPSGFLRMSLIGLAGLTALIMIPVFIAGAVLGAALFAFRLGFRVGLDGIAEALS